MDHRVKDDLLSYG